jgi:hypothetical protein
MSEDTATSAAIGMYVEVQRGIWPQLFDDLSRLPKGTARVQRLRALAYAGLLAERRSESGASTAPAPSAERRPSAPRGAEGIFEAPLDD